MRSFMKNYIFTIILALLFFINNNVFTQVKRIQDSAVVVEDPVLLHAGDGKYLVVWDNGCEAYHQYMAQYISENRQLIGNSFPVYSNKNVAFNQAGAFLTTREFYINRGDYIPDGYEINAKIYYSFQDTTPAFTIDSGWYLECGTGHLGFEKETLGLSRNFLYFAQDDGKTLLQYISENGSIINSYNDYEGAVNISMAATSDSSWMISMSKMRGYISDSLDYGVYLRCFKNAAIISDFVLVKKISHTMDFFNHNDIRIPAARITVLNDTTYQLFIIQPDSALLYSYILNETACIIDSQIINLPYVPLTDDLFSSFTNIAVSNFKEGTRAVYLTLKIYSNYHTKYHKYLYYFNSNGQYSGNFEQDTTMSLMPESWFNVKTGERTFYNATLSGNNDVVISVYDGFTKVDSFKVGQLSDINKNYRHNTNQFWLMQNYPNPFNSQTSIIFNIKQSSEVVLTIYNARGELVKTYSLGYVNSGLHKHTIEFSGAASGIYYYKLKAGRRTAVKKMVLIK